MSINVHFIGKNGEFDAVWQTPSDVTFKICGSYDPVNTYLEWVVGQNIDADHKARHVRNFMYWFYVECDGECKAEYM